MVVIVLNHKINVGVWKVSRGLCVCLFLMSCGFASPVLSAEPALHLIFGIYLFTVRKFTLYKPTLHLTTRTSKKIFIS